MTDPDSAEQPGRCVAVIDFETATKDPASACSVGWALASERDGVWSVTDNSSSLVRPPYNNYLPETIKVHGIEPADTASAPIMSQVWSEEVLPQISSASFVASYNAKFDAPVLWASLQGRGRDEMRPWRVMSLLRGESGALWRFGCLMRASWSCLDWDGPSKLSDLCEHAGIEQVAQHDSGDDAKVAAELLCWMANRSSERVGSTDLFDNAYGAWMEFNRNGPAPAERELLTLRPAGILAGVTDDGRIHHQRLTSVRGRHRA